MKTTACAFVSQSTGRHTAISVLLKSSTTECITGARWRDSVSARISRLTFRRPPLPTESLPRYIGYDGDRSCQGGPTVRSLGDGEFRKPNPHAVVQSPERQLQELGFTSMGTLKPAPPTAPSEALPGDRLNSWKEIAAYLKRDVRTLRRWEVDEGLPIRRHLHKKRGSVYAYR